MTKKFNIFLLIIMFLCSFTLSSCNTKSFVSSYYDLNGKIQEFVIKNKETYEFRVDEWYYIKLEGTSYDNSLKIKANKNYFEINQNEIVPIKECVNEKIVLYSGMNSVVFYVNATKIDKYVDWEVTFHPKAFNKFFINYDCLDINSNPIKEFAIKEVIVGDIVRMYYNGGYDHTLMDCNNDWWGGEIIKIEKINEAIPYTFIIDENYVPIIKDSDIEYTFHRRVNILEKYNVIIDDEKYTTTDTLEVGQVLYGFACVNNPNEIVSLYSYNPNA